MADTAVLNLKLLNSKFNAGIKESNGLLGKLKKAGPLAIGAMTAAFTAGGAVISSSLIRTASDAKETSDKFFTIFENVQKSADTMAKSLAKDFGLAAQTSQDLLSSSGDLLVGLGFTEKQALETAGAVARLGGDLASFNNLQGGTSDAVNRLVRGMLGEVESLKALNITMDQGSKSFRKLISDRQAATGETRLQARASVVLATAIKQSQKAIGDTARTFGTVASRGRQLSEAWLELRTVLGGFLTEVLNVPQIMGNLVEGMNSFSTSLKGFLQNFQENWKIALDWLANNWGTFFSSTLPKLFGFWVKTVVSQVATIGKIITDSFVGIISFIQGKWEFFWANGGPAAILESLIKIGTKFTDFFKELFNRIIEIAKGNSASVGDDLRDKIFEGFNLGASDGGLDEALNMVFANAAKTAKKSLGLIKNDAKDLVKSIKSDFSKVKFNLTFDDKSKGLVDSVNNAGTGTAGTAGTAGNQQKAQNNLSGAFIKGSIGAAALSARAQGNKTEQGILEENKKQTAFMKKQSRNGLIVKAYSVG